VGHIPNIGNPARRDNVLAEADSLPQPEVLGVVKESITDPTPQREGATWQRESGETMEFVAPPPPWEVDAKGQLNESDARLFVDVPKDWTLRWINPKLLDQFGWRYWQPVMASDPRVKVKVSSMVSVDNNIRRGGQTGDILAWMYTTWVVSRRQQLAKQADELAGKARDREASLNEEFQRGSFGPYVRAEARTQRTLLDATERDAVRRG